jgi:ferrous iron transport protein A
MIKMKIDLTQLKPGETGVVEEIQGGHGLIRKLQSMGVRTGKRITKVSSHFWRGPQTVEINNMQIAIGFGMAKKILVKVEK